MEFALVAPMLFALIFSTFELGWYMVQAELLDRGLDRAVRAVRIGAAGPIDHGAFKSMVCDEAAFLRSCEDDLVVEMIPVSEIGDFPEDDAVCVDRAEPVAPVIRFDPGARSQTLFVRACLLVQPIVPGLGLGRHLEKDADGNTRMVSVSAFVNEPE